VRGRDAVDRLKVRHVKPPPRLLPNVVIARVARAADDLETRTARGGSILADVLSDRVGIRKVEARHRVVDDRDGGRAGTVVLGEVAPEHERNADVGEVPGAGLIEADDA